MSRLVLLFLLPLLLAGCDWHLPGKPIRKEAPDVATAEGRKTLFNRAYFVNCLGCHGPDGRDGAARPMHDPLYLEIVPTATLEAVIRDGHGLLMPGFKKTLYGGMTDKEIAFFVEVMRERWGGTDSEHASGEDLPSYAQPEGAGDPARGGRTFATMCGTCHAPDGTGLPDGAGSVVDPMYLRLVSDQALRSTVIFGRIDLGCPNFRGPYPGQPEGGGLSSSEIDDVTAWLISNRLTIEEEAAR